MMNSTLKMPTQQWAKRRRGRNRHDQGHLTPNHLPVRTPAMKSLYRLQMQNRQPDILCQAHVMTSVSAIEEENPFAYMHPSPQYQNSFVYQTVQERITLQNVKSQDNINGRIKCFSKRLHLLTCLLDYNYFKWDGRLVNSTDLASYTRELSKPSNLTLSGITK